MHLLVAKYYKSRPSDIYTLRELVSMMIYSQTNAKFDDEVLIYHDLTMGEVELV